MDGFGGMLVVILYLFLYFAANFAYAKKKYVISIVFGTITLVVNAGFFASFFIYVMELPAGKRSSFFSSSEAIFSFLGFSMLVGVSFLITRKAGKAYAAAKKAATADRDAE